MTTSFAVKATRCAIEYGEPDDCKDNNADLVRRNQIVLKHLPLVKLVAVRMRAALPVHIELNDLTQAGTLGLIDAANKYDPARGILFETYAKYRIRGAILDGLRQFDWASRGLRQLQNHVETITRELTAELLRTPTDTELAEKAGMDLDDWRETALTLANIKHIHSAKHAPEESDAPPMQDPPSPPDTFPDWICAIDQLSDTVHKVMETLPVRSRTILQLYYKGEKSMKEIGGLIGVNESRVSQVHKAALMTMAKALKVKGVYSSQAI
jgi:RNA polymerase sigma factor FliA